MPNGLRNGMRARRDGRRERRKRRIGEGVALAQRNLFVCRIAPPACAGAHIKLIKNKDSILAAGARMNHGILWGLGGGVASIVAILCFAFGLRSTRRGSQHCKRDGAKSAIGSSPNRPERSTSLPHRMLDWWSGNAEALAFTQPMVTFKLFILALLVVEFNCVVMPGQAIIATPELLEIERGPPPNWKRLNPQLFGIMPPLTRWCMPGFNDETTDTWIHRLHVVRVVLLLSWFTFLAMPRRTYGRRLATSIVEGSSYALGAILYFYLGATTLEYCPTRSTQGTMLFILCASAAVPSLEQNSRSGVWLRKFLLFSILTPTYLFAGIAKFRYKGVRPHFTGRWAEEIFFRNVQKDNLVWPSAFEFMKKRRVMMLFVSYGNMIMELILPKAVMLNADCRPLRNVFHLTAFIFHVASFLLLGPNFTHYILLHLLSLDPLSFLPSKALQTFYSTSPTVPYEPSHQISVFFGDWLRAGIGTLVLLEWYRVNFISDISHLLGYTRRRYLRDPIFPIPEFAMFAAPKNDNEAAYTVSLCMTLLSLVFLGVKIFGLPFDLPVNLPRRNKTKKQ